MKIIIGFMLALLSFPAFCEEMLVAYVKVKSYDLYSACKENEVCMTSWVVHTLEIQRIVKGHESEKTLRAGLFMHAPRAYEKDQVIVAVLNHIADANERKAMNADYKV